jgi:hypothetical protein
MPFVKGQSGNPAGRKKSEPSLSSIRCDVRRSTIRIVGTKAPELIDLAVRKALVGNDASLAACLTLLAQVAGDTPTQQPGNAPATNLSQPESMGADR